MSDVVRAWLPGPIDRDMQRAIDRLARTEGVVHVALMPDAHLAEHVCVGTVLASSDRIFPEAVGGDIGCGMCALRFRAEADRIDDADSARTLFDLLRARIPILVRPDPSTDIDPDALSHPSLAKRAARDGAREHGTIGRGNHFLELQRDGEGSLWAMIHTGSRIMGPSIRDHHVREAPRSRDLAFIAAEDAGAYLSDVAWARAYARSSRRRIADTLVEILHERFGIEPDEASYIDVDHNHVALETHASEKRSERACYQHAPASGATSGDGCGRALWVHRKGAMHAPDGAPGVIPGSMGSSSYHIEGRGHPDALESCSHGAGRSMSRGEARTRISLDRLLDETRGVWIDPRTAPRLCEEAPSAYKDVGKVMRAQRELVRIVRRLDPVLVYKGA